MKKPARRWMQQEHFRNVAIAHMAERGLNEESFAEILGYTQGTLHQYMYN